MSRPFFAALLLVVATACVTVAKKTTIEDLQAEYKRRLLNELRSKELPPSMVEYSEQLQTVALSIAEDVFCGHPEVLKAESRKALNRLPKLDPNVLTGYEIKHEVKDLSETLKHSKVDEKAFFVRGWQPVWIAQMMKQMVLAQQIASEEMGKRAILSQFVPDKVFHVRQSDKTTVAVKSIDEFFVVNLRLTETGTFRPTAVRWLVPKKAGLDAE